MKKDYSPEVVVVVGGGGSDSSKETPEAWPAVARVREEQRKSFALSLNTNSQTKPESIAS